MSDDRPQKRTRVGLVADVKGFKGLLQDRTKHEVLWFEDGNIILATASFLFRVHRTFLSFHSPVFARIFARPSSFLSCHTEMLDGAPIMEVKDDDGIGMAHLLRALYDRSYVF